VLTAQPLVLSDLVGRRLTLEQLGEREVMRDEPAAHGALRLADVLALPLLRPGRDAPPAGNRPRRGPVRDVPLSDGPVPGGPLRGGPLRNGPLAGARGRFTETQSLGPELADRVEHAEGGLAGIAAFRQAWVRRALPDEHVLVHQADECRQYLLRRELAARAHGFRRHDVEPAGEDRQPLPQQLLGGRAQ
jgi:hypothetical protein